jgi:hypothetical protein
VSNANERAADGDGQEKEQAEFDEEASRPLGTLNPSAYTGKVSPARLRDDYWPCSTAGITVFAILLAK